MASRSRAPRRRWSVEFKKRVAAEASQPGVSAAEIARRYDLNANLLFNWKNKFGNGIELVPVEISSDNGDHLPTLLTQRPDVGVAAANAGPSSESIEIDLPCGVRLRCGSGVSPMRLAEIISALRSKS
jgi:transposase